MVDVVILAAGKGTRMKSTLPKVLHHVGGKPLLQHVVDTAYQLEAVNLHIVIGNGAESVKSTITDSQINWVLQEQQLGTGHAVQQAIPFIKSDVVLVLYGDVPLISLETLQAMLALVDNNTLSILTVTLSDPTGYGRILRDNNQKIVGIIEQKDATSEQLKIPEGNTGVMAIPSQYLQQWLPKLSSNNAQGEFYLTDIVALAKAEGVKITSISAATEQEVLGVNNRSQQAQLERYYQSIQAEKFMQDGVTLMDPSRFDCRGKMEIGNDVIIDINCVFEGHVVIGNNVKIGPNCHITDSVIGDNTIIKSNSVLEKTSIAEDCDIGPFARLRPGTVLHKKTKIGNFVETKKSVIGEGSKVNHLTYIGDADIGKNVNIGAGTITCNYDGVNKFKTEIEDDVFIGSNSSLIAPVKIGQGATVGAGSAITKSIEENTLAIARGKQRNIKDWPKPSKK